VSADIGLGEPKLFAVASNNSRNAHLPQVLAVRLTTSPKPALPSIIELGHPEAFVGRAVCDDIVELYESEIVSVVGALSPIAMRAVGRGLSAALALG
jgi:mRNA interferase MazF